MPGRWVAKVDANAVLVELRKHAISVLPDGGVRQRRSQENVSAGTRFGGTHVEVFRCGEFRDGLPSGFPSGRHRPVVQAGCQPPGLPRSGSHRVAAAHGPRLEGHVFRMRWDPDLAGQLRCCPR